MKYDVQLNEVNDELKRQIAKWSEQNHDDGTGGDMARQRAEIARAYCDKAAANGHVSWRDILEEEVAEAFAESDPAKLREELIQVAAVAVQWVAAIDRRVNAQRDTLSGIRSTDSQ